MLGQTIEIGREVIGYFQMTGLNVVKPVPGAGSVVMIQAQDTSVRYRPDGIDPSGTVGVLLSVGESHTLNLGHGNINKIRIIETAPSAKVNVIVFK